jgi:hypothetical protein
MHVHCCLSSVFVVDASACPRCSDGSGGPVHGGDCGELRLLLLLLPSLPPRRRTPTVYTTARHRRRSAHLPIVTRSHWYAHLLPSARLAVRVAVKGALPRVEWRVQPTPTCHRRHRPTPIMAPR